MEVLDSDLFKEWLGLAGGPTPAADAPLGPDDALVVIDMQADFLPHDAALNPHGGRFGVGTRQGRSLPLQDEGEGAHLLPRRPELEGRDLVSLNAMRVILNV